MLIYVDILASLTFDVWDPAAAEKACGKRVSWRIWSQAETDGAVTPVNFSHRHRRQAHPEVGQSGWRAWLLLNGQDAWDD